MRILFVLPSLQRAGAEMQTVDLLNGLAESGHSAHLFFFDPRDDLKIRLAPEVSLHYVARRSKLDTQLAAGLAKILDDQKIDVVVGVLDYAVLVAWMARRKSSRKPPIVASLHSLETAHFKAAVQDRIVYRWLFKQVDHIIFVCEGQRDRRTERFAWMRDKSSVVYNGIDYRNFRAGDFREAGSSLRASLDISANDFIFACVAQFRPEKRHDLLIDIFARLNGAPYLVLAGDGPCREDCERQVLRLGIRDRVRFLGDVPDARPVIAASNTTVLASRTESFSMAMLESMALGVPMVASRIGGLPEAIIDGVTGRTFPVFEPGGLRTCMQDMLDNPDETAALGTRSEEIIRDRFSREQMIQSTENVLTGVIRATQESRG